MQKLEIKLWVNDKKDDWSIVVNGLRHDHVSSRVVEDLVEGAVMIAEASLLEAKRGRIVDFPQRVPESPDTA